MAPGRREGANTDIASNIPSGNSLWKRKNSGPSSAVTDPVSLKVLSCNVAGLSEELYGHFHVADFDAHRLGRFCCCKNVSENWME